MALRPLALALCLATSALGAEVVYFDWPTEATKRELIAHIGASLLPIGKRTARPTVVDRMLQPPFVSGDGKVGIDLALLQPAAAAALRKAAVGGKLGWDTFAPTAEPHYAAARAPRTLAELNAKHNIRNGPDWVAVDVSSNLTKGHRRIWFNARTVLEASVAALERGSPRVVYPVDTWFSAEQYLKDGSLEETHLTGKRSDHDWDFLIYDAKGAQATVSASHDMRAPFQCFSCHRNMARMAPFRDFPEASKEAEGFLPAVRRQLAPADVAVINRFTIPGVRPDEVHGIYGGLAALQAREWKKAGKAPAWLEALWPRLVKVAPELSPR